MIAATQDTSTHTYLALFKLAALEEWHESLHLGATRRFKRDRSVRVSHYESVNFPHVRKASTGTEQTVFRRYHVYV